VIDLFAEVRNFGGQIVRSDDGFMVRGVDNHVLNPAILSALVAHRSDLDMLVPSLTEVEGRQAGRIDVNGHALTLGGPGKRRGVGPLLSCL
jgi:hypothetical protein